MSFLQAIIEWTHQIFSPLGVVGLFFLAVIESAFFPVPVEVLLIPLSAASPNLFWLFALIAALGSVIGGVLGYYIGLGVDFAVLHKIFSKRKLDRAHNMLAEHEEWAVFVGGFTPLPYKVFAISAGLFNLSLKRFIYVSSVARTLRFLLVAGVVALFVGADGYLRMVNWITVIVSVVLILLIFVIRHYNQKTLKTYHKSQRK